MLYLHQSNHLETLASALSMIHAQVPLTEVFAAENIVVQSQGMRRYLNRYLAEQTGIAANLHFSLPAGFSWRLMQQVMPNLSSLNPFSPQVLQWRLMRILSNTDFAQEHPLAWEKLQPYLSSSPSALYDLSSQLADIFDQYLVYRPAWLDTWQQGRLLDLGKDESWQQALWQTVAQDSSSNQTPHRAQLWQNLLNGLNAEHLPERIFIFGIAAMAPMYLQLFQTIAKHIDVHIFALNPCADYWYQLIEPEQILAQGLDEDLDSDIKSQIGHPLLASLGKQGRDFLNHLTSESELEYSGEHFQMPNTNTLLGQLQQGILTLQSPEKTPEATLALNDGSIAIHSTHSPLRELQILKDQLLNAFTEHPDWQPHDIAVLTPNIEPYTPFIEAIFGEHAPDGVRIPYSVADVKISQKQPFLSGLSSLLDLLQSRFEVSHILPLLDNPCLLARFDLDLDDAPHLMNTLKELNIRWGLDSTMRAKFGGQSNAFTWSQGLERMALGLVLPDNHVLSDDWQNHAPLASSLEELPMFSQWLSLWQSLSRHHALFSQEATVDEWLLRLQQLSDDCLFIREEDTSAATHWSQTLASWQQEAYAAHLDQKLPFHLVAKHLSQNLSSSSEAGFLRQGITFCSMIPMRSLPFKVICLLGLNDGSFPRNFSKPEFDLINLHPAKGDRSHRDDDRYLFLESMISAREILYLSYLGKSQDKNDDMAASPLLHELIDVVASMSGKSTSYLWENWVKQHPLQAFSKRYYSEQDGLFSYRQDYAKALSTPSHAKTPFLEDAVIPSANDAWHVNVNAFIQFWKNPVKHWLKQQLGWHSQYLESALVENEPFTVEDENTIYQALYQARRDGQDFAQVHQKLAAQNTWPDGFLAEHWQNTYNAQVASLPHDWFNNQHEAPLNVQYTFDNITLSGSLQNRYSNGLVTYQTKPANSTDEVAVLLEHLMAAAMGNTQNSLWVWPPAPQMLSPIEPDTARRILNDCLCYWRIGQQQPLPFFARTSLKAAKKWAKHIQAGHNPKDPNQDKLWQEIIKEAQLAFNGNKISIGQKDYEEIKLVFGEMTSHEVLDMPLFLNTIETIWVPLVNHIQAITEQ